MDDEWLKKQVIRELRWHPLVEATSIGVSVTNGVVTLTGRVSSYLEKLAAVEAAERVYGVRVVADELEVEPQTADVRDDSDIARAILHSLRWNVLVPDTVKVEVRDGHVRLLGRARRDFQRRAAEKAARSVKGVKSVTNLIALEDEEPPAPPDPGEIERRVREAIRSSFANDARGIWVETQNGTVRLHGRVHSLYEKRVAEDAARSAGATEVENQIMVALD
jgi:osmotically-inducible protein OsmY